MLKLKKIHILGFKSFCDRTELTVAGTGMAVVVGPNGCGKSNILDGVSWVLGEQSAKSLRGTQMADVIFAGTRDRKPLGMAEVTLTMVDPDAYDGPIPVEPEVMIDNDVPSDWNEEAIRKAKAEEAEEIVANEQPGQILDEDGNETPGLPQLVESGTDASPSAKASTCSTESSAACAISRTSSWALALARRATRSSARSESASCSAPSRTTAAPSSKKPPASPASRPRSVSPNSASKRRSRTSPASTTFSKKSRG